MIAVLTVWILYFLFFSLRIFLFGFGLNPFHYSVVSLFQRSVGSILVFTLLCEDSGCLLHLITGTAQIPDYFGDQSK